MAEQRLETWDLVVVIIYFVVVIGVGITASCRASRGTLSGYFLAGRNMIWVTVGASLFVSNIGSEHFIGLSGSGAAGGIGVGAWEFNAILLLQLLGWVFIPVYIACATYTMPEYLSKRFGGSRLRVYFALLSLVLYIFTKCSVDLYTGALFIQQSLGWDLYLSIFILIAITAVLTITGGLTAVIYTDTLQAFLMVGGAIVLMIMGFIDIGGYDGLVRKYPLAMTNVTVPGHDCHKPSENAFKMLRGPADPDMPWPGFLLGQTPGSIWYWCADQVIVQRALAAKSLSHAQGATLMAGFIKVLPLFIMVMPGMISRIKYPNEVACVDPDECYKYCQSYAGCTNIAYPRLVLGLMPTGLKGLMMAVMIAALMSDLDSIFNSASTLFTIDIWKKIRKKAGIKEQMIVGRVFILVMMGVAIAWVPVVKETQGGQVFIYIQEITNYFAPPIAAVFVIGVIWPRANEQGAFWGLMAGFVTGLARLILIFIFRPPGQCGEEDTRPAILKDFHYMYFAMLLYWITTIVCVVISLLTAPLPPEKTWKTTFWSRHDSRTLRQVRAGVTLDQLKESQGDDANDTRGIDNPALSVDDVELKENGKKVWTTPSEDVEEQPSKGDDGDKQKWCAMSLKDWLCGFDSFGEESQTRENQRMLIITSLKQDKMAKYCLNFGLFVILALGTGLYIFWSTWKYIPDELNGYNTTSASI